MSFTSIIATFNEQSNGAIGVSVTGLNDEALTPVTFVWTLTDNNGTVINSRLNVSETPAAETWILLSGDDLAIPDRTTSRKITISGTLNTTLGGIARIGLPYTVEYSFNICNQRNTV
jgi:hypothetical protein